MKKWMLLLVLGLLGGCEYTVPLVKSPQSEIDRSLVGLWQRTKDDGQVEQLCVLPLDQREYLVSYPSGQKESMFARGCLCRLADQTGVQLQWFGTGEGKLLEDNRAYQFVSYSLAADTLTVRLLSSDVIRKEAATTEELATAIAANQANPALFKEPMVFTKVKD